MKINIVFANHSKYINGGYKVIYEYSNYLAKKGHDVCIYFMLQKSIRKFNVPKFLVPAFCYFLSHYYPRWFDLEKNIHRKGISNSTAIRDADVSIATAVETAELVSHLGKEKGKKVYFIQDFETWAGSPEFVESTYKLGMHNITISNWLSKIVEENSGIKPICIKDGIDSAIFNCTNKRDRGKSLVFHYRSLPYKGADIAIKVIERLKKKFPSMIVYVVSNEDISHLPDWFVKKQKIKSNEVSEINNVVTVFLCTSRNEGYGLPGLEAMACGCALVSTAYQGVLEYAVDGKNALLAPVDDVDRLVENVTKLFEDDELRERIVHEGLKTAEDLTVINAGKEFEKALIDVVNE